MVPTSLNTFQIESSATFGPPRTAKLPTIPPMRSIGSIYDTPVRKWTPVFLKISFVSFQKFID
jgi:hypothetical protein